MSKNQVMQNFYLIIVVILFALAISDLIVGVSNDAVNFLNSAIGSKVARKWVIYMVAALGVLIGATFSTGMMEVARKGVFYPQMFDFSEIMLIFLAVMITDVVLLDAFNTFGLPTSTTVSLIFELLGSAFAVSMVKISNAGGSYAEIGHYINSGKAFAIISGILVSIVIALVFSVLIQYLVRIVFTFNYGKKLRYAGSLFGGTAITLISYFILIKGINGSSFAELRTGFSGMTLSEWIKEHTGLLLLASLAGWTTLLQLLWWLFKIDILKVVVLAGTFALAMAFAGNDLVNFIGVPVAGFNSFHAWVTAGAGDPSNFKMEMLLGDVDTPFLFLLIAGVIMVITLITSKKAKAVTSTEVNLGRQGEGVERFGSSAISRAIVRSSVKLNRRVKKLLPEKFNDFIMDRFKPAPVSDDPAAPSFDKLRAAVNLMVASSLIAFGTSLKLPLSTTYVTFMVAMGTSLADRSWGRDSAVYRVSGVFTVIAGWFLTAVIAFSVSALIALGISIGGMWAIIGLIVLSIVLVFRTQVIFRKRSQKTVEEEDMISEVDETKKRLEKASGQAIRTIIASDAIFKLALESFLSENIGKMREAVEMDKQLDERTKKHKNNIIPNIAKMRLTDVDSGYFYIQMIDYEREMAHSIHYMVEPLREHMENQHKPFNDEQSAQIRQLVEAAGRFFILALEILKGEKFKAIEELVSHRTKIAETLYKVEKDQVKRIKGREVNTRNSLLFFKAMSETKNLLLQTVNLVKSYRDFVLTETNDS